MCLIHNPRKIDKCMLPIIEWLNTHNINTVACCCGHGIYPKTIIVEEKDIKNVTQYREIFSGRIIKRTKRFYKKDEEGYYYIPIDHIPEGI